MATTRKKGCCDKSKEQEEKTRKELVARSLRSAYFQSETEREECIKIYANRY